MPIYEYICEHCGRRSSFFVRNIAAHRVPDCPHCGKSGMHRAISLFMAKATRKSASSATRSLTESASELGEQSSVPTTEEDTQDTDFGESGRREPDYSEMEAMLENMDENDPRAMGRVMRKLAEESGQPLDEEMEEVIRRLEAGEDPEKIDEKMDNLGARGAAGDVWYDG